MSSVPQFLYACRDNYNGQSYALNDTTASGWATQNAAVMTPAGMSLQLASGGAQYYGIVDNWYHYFNYGTGAFFARMTAANTTTNVVNLLPINDTESWPVLQNANQTAPVGSLIQPSAYIPVDLPIDLSEAEPGYYKYLILSRACVIDYGIAAPIRSLVSTYRRPGNPFYQGVGSGYIGAGRITIGNGITTTFFQAHSMTVRGGDVRTVHMLTGTQPGTGQPNAFACVGGALAAIRVDNAPVFVEASGGAFASPGAETTYISVTAPEAGDYLIVGYCSAGCTSEAYSTLARISRYNAAGTYVENFTALYQIPMNTPVAGADRRTLGCVRWRTGVAAGETFRITLEGAQSRIDAGYICCMKLPAGVTAAQAAIGPGSGTFNTTPTGITSGTLTAPKSGRYLECIDWNMANAAGGGGTVQIRPHFFGDPMSYYSGTSSVRGVHYQQTDRGFQYTPVTSFARTRMEAGQAAASVDVWCASGTGTYSTGGGTYTALHFEDQPAAGADQIVSAKVEYAYWYRRWESEVWADSFGKTMPMGSRPSRIIRNGVELTRISSAAWLASLPAADYWSYDEATARLRVRLPASQTPADSGMVLLACFWLYAATEKLDLIEPPDAINTVETPQPYKARLLAPPSYSQEVSADGTGVTSSSSLGQIDLSAEDAFFDPDVRQRRFDGFRTIIRRGPKSDLREIKHRVQVVATNGGHQLAAKLSLRLYSSLIELTRPVLETQFQIYQGGILRDPILVPLLLGPMNRIPGYAVTWNPGSANSTQYRFTSAALGLESIGALYLDTNTLKAWVPTGTTVDAANGVITIPNSQFSDPNTPPDVIYAQAWGTRATPGDTSSRGLRFPGEMARTLLKIGNVPLNSIDEQSFIDFDRIWRKRITGGAPIPLGPSCAIYLDQTISIGDAVTKVLAQAFGMRSELPAGRVNAGVLDFTAQQLATNSGFESSATDVWPWGLAGGATGTVTTLPTYEGSRAVEIGTGGGPTASMWQAVMVRKPRFAVAATPLAAARSGLTDYVRIGWLRPSDGWQIVLSDPMRVESTGWNRLVHWLQLDEDEVGTVLAHIFPAYGQGATTAIVVDNFEVWPVAVISRQRKTATLSEEDEEAYYQARVEVTLNSLGQINPAIVLTDGDLAGLAAGASLARFASPGSGRADFGADTRMTNADSSTGVAAALLRYFASPRFKLRTTELLGPGWRRPAVNDILLDDSQWRKVSTQDMNPIYSIRRVATGKSPQTVDIEAETRGSLISDTLQISPQKVPLGLILPSTDGNCPTDWQEYTQPADYYLTGASGGTAVGAIVGTWRHTHTLDHTHTVTAHTHQVSGITAGAMNPADWITSSPVSGPWVDASRNDHTHNPIPGGPWNTGAMTGGGTSSLPTGALSTSPSGNVLSCLRVKLCKRTANTLDPVPTNLAFFSETNAAPGGYTRHTGFDGQVLRVSSALAALSTTTSGAHTPGASTSSFVVVSATGIVVGRVIKVTGGGNTYSGVVTSVAGTTIGVDVFNLDGEVGGVSYPSGSTVTSPATTAGTAETWASHRHGGGIGGHLHTESHSHIVGSTSAQVPAPAIGAGTTTTNIAAAFNELRIAALNHGHSVDVSIPNATQQSSGSAGGTIDSSTPAAPDTLALVWHKAVSGSTLQVATGLGGFVDGAVCPPGWVEYTTGLRRLLKGAAAGAGILAVSGTHSHNVTFLGHTDSHNHGGSVPGQQTADLVQDGPAIKVATVNQLGAYGGSYSGGYGGTQIPGHHHAVTMSGVATVAATLPTATGASSAVVGEANMPPSYALRMCVKG